MEPVFLKRRQAKCGFTNNEVSSFLKKARAFIERGWTKGAYARAKNGKVISEWDPRACRWCMRGALNASLESQLFSKTRSGAVYGVKDVAQWDIVSIAEAELERAACTFIFVANDQAKKKEDILKIFDAAISRLEAHPDAKWTPPSDEEFARWFMPRANELGWDVKTTADQIASMLGIRNHSADPTPVWITNLVEQLRAA